MITWAHAHSIVIDSSHIRARALAFTRIHLSQSSSHKRVHTNVLKGASNSQPAHTHYVLVEKSSYLRIRF